jgi:hypothetical protein
MNRWIVGEDMGSKEMDGYPLMVCDLFSFRFIVLKFP